MKQLTIGLILFATTVVGLFGCNDYVPAKNIEYKVEITTQHGLVDTLSVQATSVYLYEGNLYREYTDEKQHERRETIASGVYRFTKIN